jgi:hypothetical protein
MRSSVCLEFGLAELKGSVGVEAEDSFDPHVESLEGGQGSLDLVLAFLSSEKFSCGVDQLDSDYLIRQSEREVLDIESQSDC